MSLTNLEFYAIMPKEVTNLVTNPSFETGTTGWAVYQGAMAQVATYQRRGVYSVEVTPDASKDCFFYYNTSALLSGYGYTFSVDVLGTAGQTYQLQWITADGATLKNSTTFVASGHWQRKSLKWDTDAATAFRVAVVRPSVANTNKFYVDGAQVEYGNLSSYLDGDMKGFVRGQVDYYWTGIPHASTSFRSGQTRSGGTEVRLRDYLNILAVFGLGMAPVINNALPNVRGGAFFQNSVLDSRTISLSTKILGATPGDLMKSRAAVLAAISPRQTQADQPMILRIKGFNDAGAEQAETVDAIVQYSGGMEGGWETKIESAPLQFTQFLPYLANEAEIGQAVTINQSVANNNRILMRGRDGLWKAMGTGANGSVLSFANGPDGYLYAGGAFTLAGGVANTAYVAKWDGAAWSALSTGMNGDVKMLRFGFDGTLYAGGAFTSAAGVANTSRIAKWNGSAWSALGTGANDTVWCLAVGNDGSLYAGGTFTSMGGVANTSHIAKWNGSAWSALGTGANGDVRSIAVAKDGSLYVGGFFTSAGGVSNTARVAKWNGSAWTAMGTGMSGGDVYALAFGLDGTLYAGGDFTAAGGASNTAYAAKWNGVAWATISANITAVVQSITTTNDGMIYFSGQFTSAGGVPLLNGFTVWNGSSFANSDVELNGGGALVNDATIDRVGNLYLAGGVGGAATAPYVATITNNNGYPVYPKILMTGPGSVYQIKNVTSGKVIYFNLTLVAGETAILDLDPVNPKFTSSFRGNIINTILPGSNLDWTLFTGTNSVSVFIAGTTSAATTCSFVWRPLYATYDGAVY